ncbi:Stp1/IreP family PP2C-type Ser/Thr phosphatase [Lederbergia citrea]|uniref:protein-serine/threonine phosphatase n=1 Tax=Lederbergia citrea TaxID=2833581 RepID=A0A942ULR0_9BACI|nr:Stp1/IreP family PP2C-type Ser/Thr phosphatase [Lederbergia citrea]MBS4177170.1 Stp1/IreP family PP2C-type Ser/Thr phosphatase [Lederbergia citrea]MBS4203833.1 Stp1/IreP family PP2C-type Ser/Thr phosphatase [Lederbergia citrea]MBS4221582.1 Stp1/IreP family PP2C-type Ser/Thr phosphatase [Lederbergia citrea]
MIAFFKTDQGMVRRNNEDNGGVFFNSAGNCLAIVADGMGGHNAGEVASQIAVSSIREEWCAVEKEFTPDQAEKWLRTQITAVNEKIFKHSQTHKECDGMGTTIVAAICTPLFATVVNIGDSRCYLLNENGFKQITEDHSLVNELIKTGQISREDAELHPRKNVLLKTVGTESVMDMDITTITFEEGDKLLLCSDGLSNKVSNDEMATILNDGTEVSEKTTTLIGLANKYGGEDNISLAIIEACIESRCEEC